MDKRLPLQRKPLNIYDPTVQDISKRFNIAPKVVAYIRAAILNGRYNKLTLIEHIKFENEGRRQAIEAHKINESLSEEKRKNLIEWTTINIKFREGVIEILEQSSDQQLRNILRK